MNLTPVRVRRLASAQDQVHMVELLDRAGQSQRSRRAVGVGQRWIVDVDGGIGAHRNRPFERVARRVRTQADHGDLAAELLFEAQRGFERMGIVAIHNRRDPGRRDDPFGRLVDLEVGRRDIGVGDLLDRDDDVHRKER